MNELLKFTIIITIIVLIAFVVLQCVYIISDTSKVLKDLLRQQILDELGKEKKK